MRLALEVLTQVTVCILALWVQGIVLRLDVISGSNVSWEEPVGQINRDVGKLFQI